MTELRVCTGVLVSVALFLLGGCAAWEVNQVAQNLPAAGPQETLAKLAAITPPARDRVQYLLDSGLLKLYTGDFDGGRQDLQQAKEAMAALDAVSVTENLAAVTANETLRSYAGSASDHVLVHVALALCYLLGGDLDGARVEVLQADVTMGDYEGDDAYGHLASARFLAGLIYEMAGERDDALISYRKAYAIMTERDESIPPALQTSLLNLTRSQGFDEEYAKYERQFDRNAQLPTAGQGQWIVFYFDGVVSQKTETRLSLFNRDMDTMISVVMPMYPQVRSAPQSLNWQVDDNNLQTRVIENVERRVRQDLDKDYAAILATAVARAVAKYKMVQEAQDQNELAGVLVNILTVATEQADLRSWNMLPAYIQVARATAPLTGRLSIPAKNFHYQRPDDARGNFVVLFASSFSPAVFSYP